MKLSYIFYIITAFFGFSFQEHNNDFTHVEQLFLHKKTNKNPRSIELEKETIINGLPLEQDDLLYLQTILSKCQCKKITLYVFGPESIQYFGLINNKDQTKDYLWMTTDLFYYSKTNRYYIIKDKKDKEWMKKFFEKYESQ